MDVRYSDRSVWQLRRMIEEEKFVLMAVEELDNFLVEDVLRIYRFPFLVPANLHIFRRFRIWIYRTVGVRIASDRRRLSVLKEIRRVKTVATLMVIITVVILPAVPTDPCAGCSKPPFQFSYLSRDVTRCLSDLCQKHVVGIRLKTGCMNQLRNLIQGQLASTQSVIESTLCIRPRPLMAIVDPRQHTGTGGRAERTPVGMVEPHSFACETVDIRCLEMLLSIAAEHTASEVVCEDENYIWVIGHNHGSKSLKNQVFSGRYPRWNARCL